MASFGPNQQHRSYEMLMLMAGILLFAAVKTSTAEFPRFQQLLKDDGTLDFLVVGDWGRGGDFNQSKVAEQMGIVGAKMGIQFVISTGDNFYEDGLTGTDDPAFSKSFTNIYTAPGLHNLVQQQASPNSKLMHQSRPPFRLIYAYSVAVLGNHDYRGDVEAQLSPILKGKDSRWICFRSAILNAGMVDFVFVDTTPFVDEYFNHPAEHKYDWTGVLPREKYLADLLKGQNTSSEEFTATWKVVVGHHPVKTAGEHGVTVELVHQMLPVLKENKVDFYINGHDHCLQRIASVDSKLEFLTSGGGSKAWKGEIKPLDTPQEMKFYYDGQGFLSVHMTHYKASFQFYDIFGKNLHNWDVFKLIHMSA